MNGKKINNHGEGDPLLKLADTNLFRWMGWVIWNWGLIVLSLITIGKIHNWFVWILAIVLIGSRQHAIAILGHDGTHGLACKNRRLNDFLTNLFCFLPFGANLNSYRVVHLQHHNHLGSEKDPELGFKKEMAPQWDLPTSKRALLFQFFRDLLGLGFFNVIIIMKSMPIRRSRDYLYLTLFWLATIAALFIMGELWLLGVWFVSLFLSNWAVFRLRIWTEHVGTVGTHRIKTAWWQRWLFLPHNTWYHYEHHKWPWIPFYNLSKARVRINNPDPMSFSDLAVFFLNLYLAKVTSE